jgi:hypothetical protein
MAVMLNFSKLAELRMKTDRDLLLILDGELDRGLALANVAASEQSAFYGQAEAVYARTKGLLAQIAGLPEDELSPVRNKLSELKMALDLVRGVTDPEEESNLVRAR